MLMRIMGTQPAAAQDDHRAIARPAMFSISMDFLRQAATAAAAAAFFPPALAAEPAARQFEALARLPEAGKLSVAFSRRIFAVPFFAPSSHAPIRKT
jgi:hypothetical protein